MMPNINGEYVAFVKCSVCEAWYGADLPTCHTCHEPNDHPEV